MSRAAWAETARRIEGAGFATLLVPDHFDDRFAPMPALMAAADATSSLRIGTLVAGNDYRHPVVLAKDAATLDVLSDGRFELGLGAGWETRDYEWSGIALDPPSLRVERLTEAVTIIKGLFADDPCRHHGRHYAISDLDGRPKPVQRPHPPILIGAGGPQMLTLAAREADIVNVNFRLSAGVFGATVAATGTGAATKRKLDVVRTAAGAGFQQLELSTTVFGVAVTTDRAAAAETMAGALGISPENVLESPHLLVGTVEAIVDELERRRTEWGFSYVAFALDTYEPMKPVVARLAGR